MELMAEKTIFFIGFFFSLVEAYGCLQLVFLSGFNVGGTPKRMRIVKGPFATISVGSGLIRAMSIIFVSAQTERERGCIQQREIRALNSRRRSRKKPKKLRS